MKFPHGLMVLKLLAILPSGSAGKFLEKNLEFVKNGGRGSEFCFRTTTPHYVPSATFCFFVPEPYTCQGFRAVFSYQRFTNVFTNIFTDFFK